MTKTLRTTEAIKLATEAIKCVCREEEPNSAGARVISDLATWEIEARLIKAVTEALRKEKP